MFLHCTLNSSDDQDELYRERMAKVEFKVLIVITYISNDLTQVVQFFLSLLFVHFCNAMLLQAILLLSVYLIVPVYFSYFVLFFPPFLHYIIINLLQRLYFFIIQ